MPKRFKVIYAYRTLDLSTRDVIAKIGMTARETPYDSLQEAALARIQEQHKSENSTGIDLIRDSPDDHLLTWDVENELQLCPWTDKEWTRPDVLELETRIHDILERKYERIFNSSGKKSELFRLILDEGQKELEEGTKTFSEIVRPIVEPVINRVLDNTEALRFKPRPHQRWVTGKVLDEWEKSKQNEVIIPLFLAPRFGKTLNVLEIWSKLEHKIGIIEAHMLSALTSFSNAIMDGFDITHEVEYLRIVPGNIDNQIEIAKNRISAGKRVLFLVSMHYSKTERDKIKNDMAENIQLFWDEKAFGESESGLTGEKWQELLQCFRTDTGDFEEQWDGIKSIVDEDQDLEPENKDGLLERLSKLKETFEMVNEDTESQDHYVDLSHLHKISELIEMHGGATIYVDEADYGAHTDRSRKVTEALLKKTEAKSCILLGTGTHIERATAPFGDKLACFPITVTYSDMLIAKKSKGFLFDGTYLKNLTEEQKNEKEAITYTSTNKVEEMKLMKGYVEPKALFLRLSNEVVDIMEDGDKTPSWARLHGSPKNSDALRALFKHLLEDAIGSDMNLRNHFDEINGKDERDPMGPFMTLMFFGGSSKKSVGRLVAAAKAAVPGYECIELTSDTTSNEDAELFVKGKIRRAKQEEKSGVLIFAMGMGQRSFSIGDIDAVVEIYDGGDSNVARQKQSRALTPRKEKQVGFIVCLSFNQERYEHMLPMILKDASALLNRKEVDSLTEGIKTVYRTQLWYHLNGDNEPTCRFESGESLIEEVLNNQSVISKVLGSMCTPDAIMCDDELLEIALNLAKSVSKVSTKHNQSAERILKAVKTHKGRSTGEVENGEEDAEDLSVLTVAKLKERCKAAGLPVSGKKDLLIERLKEFHQKENDATTEEDYNGVAKNIVRQAIERICRLPHLFAVNFPQEEKFLSVLDTIEADTKYSEDLERLLGIDINSTKKLVDAMFKEESTQLFLDMAFTNSRNIVQNEME